MAEANNNQQTKKKILLAEDDKFISVAYRHGLEQAGFEVILASDGQQAMEKAKAVEPDLILLDIIMPIKNGFDVLEYLQANAELKKIPVIILSNLGQEVDIKRGQSLGAVDYLIKANHSLEDVINKVKEHLRD